MSSINIAKRKYKTVFICIFIMLLIVSNIEKVNAYTKKNLSFRSVDRWGDIFNYYLDRGDQLGFDCILLEEEIDKINDKIDYLDDKIDESIDDTKSYRYRLDQKSYKSILRKYRNFKPTCTEKGSIPPFVSEHFIRKYNENDDIRFSLTDRENHEVRVSYYLSEEDDDSLTGTLVITNKILEYPYNFNGYEKYYLTLKSQERTFYLENTFSDYEDYYFYFFTNFSNSDEYFTTAPYIKHEKEEATFKDVDESHEYYDSIQKGYDEGFIKGFSDGLFHPERSILRKEFLKIAFKAREIEVLDDDDIELSFTDLENEDWAIAYIKVAVDLGFVNSENSMFYPNRDVSFIEAIKIISNIFNLEIPEYNEGVIGLPKEHWGVPYVHYFEEKDLLTFDIEDYNRVIHRDEAVDLILAVRELIKQ